MLRQILILYLLILSYHNAASQNSESNWYFGYYAGLNFSSGNPVAHNLNALTTDEGCSSISDEAGNLLFYTNGVDVYNSNHQQMSNGGGLDGHISASQSALIVKDPGDSLQYYIFTVGAQVGTHGGFSGLAWSKVDMNASGGLGSVTSKNTHLLDSTSEKLTAVMHHNGKYVWVIAHKWNSDKYYAYLLTCNSIFGPVISGTGNKQGEDISGLTSSAIGCLKANPQGNKIASSWNQFHTYSSNYFSYGYIEVCNFDNKSGKISDPKLITHGKFSNAYKQVYGLSFSASGKYLYAGVGDYTGIANASLFQYDTEAINPEITQQTIYSAGNVQSFASMQLAQNGRIYIARTNGANNLSEIRSPDTHGTGCDFVYNGVSLGSNISTWGLPNYWKTESIQLPVEIFSWTDTSICSPGAISLNGYLGYDLLEPKYLWNTGSTDSIIYVETPGKYKLQIIFLCDTLIDSVTVNIYPGLDPELGEDLLIPCYYYDGKIGYECSGCSYFWNTGDTTAFINIPKPGEYKIYVTDINGCVRKDSIIVGAYSCECEVYFPSAFTPNSDSNNDFFFPIFDCEISVYELRIFNRWGQLIFSSDSPEVRWDGHYKGRLAENGNYIYQFRFIADQGANNREQILYGNVVLIR